MKVLGVIPARFESTRFPGKPLAKINGKPLLQWVIEAAKQARLLNEVIVATDDERICQLAEEAGAVGVMTPSDLPSGTDRVWYAVKDRPSDVILNIQGDEPLMTGALLDELVAPFESEPSTEMVTLGRPMNSEDLASPNTAKIVLNHRDEAIYFSRFAIPYSRDNSSHYSGLDGSLKHIGIYAYRSTFLKQFCQTAPTLLERAEGLEQLRALYLGARIKVLRVEHDSWGVDTPEDIERIERRISKKEG